MLSLPSDTTLRVPDKCGSLGDFLDGSNYHCSSAPLEQSTEALNNQIYISFPYTSFLLAGKLVHKRMKFSVSLFLENGEVENTKVVPLV